MDRLPLEILSIIFILRLPIPPCTLSFEKVYPLRARVEALDLLRSVSRRWNDAILNTPELWSYIEVSQSSRNPRPWLELSKTVPLHARIQFGIGKAETWLNEAVKAVWESADRWKTYVGHGYIIGGSLGLLPPCPLPVVEEVWLIGFVGNNQPTIQAPRMDKLIEYYGTAITKITSAPSLKRWQTAFPANKIDWERFVEVVRLCPLLESLEFSHTEYAPPTMVGSGFTQVADNITIPTLKELIMDPATVRFDLFSYIRAPRLEKIVLQHHSNFIPFALPLPAFCPSLSRIQFVGASALGAIQAWVLTVPKRMSERVGVEIEYHRQRNACGVYEPVIPEFDSVWRKWFDENFPVRWIPVDYSCEFNMLYIPSISTLPLAFLL